MKQGFILSIVFFASMHGVSDPCNGILTNNLQEVEAFLKENENNVNVRFSINKRIGERLFTYVLKQGSPEMVKLFLSYGAMLEAKEDDRFDLPVLAAAMNYIELPSQEEAITRKIKLLFDYGAKDCKLAVWNGLWKSVIKNKPRMVKIFLDHGSDPNIRDNFHEHESVLERAAERDSFQIVDLLLKAGADPYIKTADGVQTVFDKYEIVRDVLAWQQEMNTVDTAWRWGDHVEISGLILEDKK